MYTLPPVTRNGSAPGPVSTRTSPISLSGPQVPAFACGSSHSLTFESIPNRPGGICTRNPFRNSSESERPKESVNGLNSPARSLVVSAANDGLNCGPKQFSSTSNVLVGVTSGVNGELHGVRSTVVVAGPHVREVESVARSAPWRVSWNSENGSCGVFSNVVVIWPVCWLICPVPSSLTMTPSSPSPTTCTNRRIMRPSCASLGEHGLHNGEARYTSPFRRSSSAGVLIRTVPTCESRGHAPGFAGAASRGPDPKNCSFVQSPRRAAADGEVAVPSGSVTEVRFTSGVASASGSVSCGTFRSNEYPAGAPASSVSGSIDIDGLNSSRWQPVSLPSEVEADANTPGPGASQESVDSVASSGVEHCDGFVNSATRGTRAFSGSTPGPPNSISSCGTIVPSGVPRALRLRAARSSPGPLWSAGTPQIVTKLA